jgi:hypothetical protein
MYISNGSERERVLRRAKTLCWSLRMRSLICIAKNAVKFHFLFCFPAELSHDVTPAYLSGRMSTLKATIPHDLTHYSVQRNIAFHFYIDFVKLGDLGHRFSVDDMCGMLKCGHLPP